MESTKNLLPLSNDMKESKETEHKVPTMTRKGVYTALSYMTSSGLFLPLQIHPLQHDKKYKRFIKIVMLV